MEVRVPRKQRESCYTCGGVMNGAHHTYCKACMAARMRNSVSEDREKYNKRAADWRKNNPEKWNVAKKRSILKTQYGLTEADVASLKSNQGGRCAICQGDLDNSKKTHIDHNHSTGQVRGILCHNCNLGIGLFGEDIDSLARAIDYLLIHSTEKAS